VKWVETKYDQTYSQNTAIDSGWFTVICAYLYVRYFYDDERAISKNPTPDPLSAKLSNIISQYENGEISVIDLSVIEAFSWDRLYVFGPYTPLSELESIVGRSWRNICFTHIDVLETMHFLYSLKTAKLYIV
jgi:hypothetical protein